ncbi:unnamed protein product [Aphanomyces euteiches]
MVLASSQGHGTSALFLHDGQPPRLRKPHRLYVVQFDDPWLVAQLQLGGFPSFCGGSALTQSDIDQVGADSVAQYWPDKHGTCSGVDQAAYVQAAIDIETKLGTPSIISNNIGSTVSYRDLIGAYGSGNVALRCAGSDNALSEVRTCYDRAYNQIACPASVLKQDNCGRKKSISIYTF